MNGGKCEICVSRRSGSVEGCARQGEGKVGPFQNFRLGVAGARTVCRPAELNEHSHGWSSS